MDRGELIRQVKSYIDLAKAGLESENPKVDFKSTWYNLKETKGVNEFLKDTSSIVNTYGPDGFIIIGFDERSKVSLRASFKDSGLSDTSFIIDLINKRVDRLFYLNIVEEEIEGNRYSIIHIPTSFDKPHVIRNYQIVDKLGVTREEQHRIFIRRGTQTHPASKYDIELMFYDRKNVIPEYKILSSFYCKAFGLSAYATNSSTINIIKSTIPLIMENVGARPVSIMRIDLELSIYEDPSEIEKLKLHSPDFYRSTPIIIHPNQIVSTSIEFTTVTFPAGKFDSVMDSIRKAKEFIKTKSILLTLSNGERFSSELTITK